MKRIGFILSAVVFVTALQAMYIPYSDLEYNTVESEEEQPFTELEEKWFEQYLDHFTIQDNRTFWMRYFEDDTFFKPGGPLLLEIGGEGGISADSIRTGQSYLLAKKLRGKIVLLEHRYYGKSLPFENFTAENLMFLTVEEVLEDLAYFVDTFKKTEPALEHSKVGVFGCSYSASLATWFRYKFPHLVDAAWASSAPLRAVSDFYEYLEVASEVYANVSSHCIDTIREGYDETKRMLNTSEGQEQVKAAFKNWGCGNVTEMTPEEILGNIRFVVADHNIPPNHGVESCKIFQDQSKNSSSFQKLVDFIMFKSSDVCSSAEEEYPTDGLAWSYQTCTEFGFSITTNSRKQPFNDSLLTIDEDLESCAYNFGEEFDMSLLQRGIDRINRVYGSVNLEATKVLSVHGAQDPWYKLGLYQERSEEAPVILIPGTSHCADQSDNYDEPVQLTRAKLKARKIMAKWLQ